MPQLTKKIFTDLAIWMTLLGVIIGLVFPPFTVALGFDPERAYSLSFWLICIISGVIVALTNYLLVNLIIRRKLVLISEHMRMVEDSIQTATNTGDWSNCTPEKCNLHIDSEDELGESSRTFNDLVQALFRSHDVETAISDFGKALSSQLDLDKLSETALNMLLHHTGSVAGVVITISSGKQRITASHGIQEPQGLLHSQLVNKTYLDKQMKFITTSQEIKVDEELVNKMEIQETCIIPIEFKDEVIGIVLLAATAKFQNDLKWMLKLLSQGLALALKNALIHSQLQEIAVLDGLTGVMNRHFGMKSLKNEFVRSKRSSRPLTILMFDLDHFKQINDTYGHLCGDQILIEVIRVAEKVIRESDIIVRYGGEEFIIICPDIDKKDALHTAQRLCKTIEDHDFTYEQQPIEVTISVGVAYYPYPDVETPNQLIRHADEALYYSKSHGRNRCTLFGDTLA